MGTTLNVGYYSQMEIIKHFDQLRPASDDVYRGRAVPHGTLSRGFNFCGLNLLDTPQSSHFLTFMWVHPRAVPSDLPAVAGDYDEDAARHEPAAGLPMKWMLYLMPLLTAWIAYTVPGAVGFYWTIQTTVSFVQSMLLRKFYSPALVSAKAEAQRVALREVEEARMKPLPCP